MDCAWGRQHWIRCSAAFPRSDARDGCSLERAARPANGTPGPARPPAAWPLRSAGLSVLAQAHAWHTHAVRSKRSTTFPPRPLHTVGGMAGQGAGRHRRPRRRGDAPAEPGRRRRGLGWCGRQRVRHERRRVPGRGGHSRRCGRRVVRRLHRRARRRGGVGRVLQQEQQGLFGRLGRCRFASSAVAAPPRRARRLADGHARELRTYHVVQHCGGDRDGAGHNARVVRSRHARPALPRLQLLPQRDDLGQPWTEWMLLIGTDGGTPVACRRWRSEGARGGHRAIAVCRKRRPPRVRAYQRAVSSPSTTAWASRHLLPNHALRAGRRRRRHLQRLKCGRLPRRQRQPPSRSRRRRHKVDPRRRQRFAQVPCGLAGGLNR